MPHLHGVVALENKVFHRLIMSKILEIPIQFSFEKNA